MTTQYLLLANGKQKRSGPYFEATAAPVPPEELLHSPQTSPVPLGEGCAAAGARLPEGGVFGAGALA